MLQVREVRTGRILGTLGLTAEGEVAASSEELRRMFEQTMISRGLTVSETYEWYTGWSNGYVEFVPVG
ncbi:hypothetical protein E1292_41495 [Nonomuraea deserti]|uniref:Uncharacterized protein n=1 Tax=Nonomuraea deserti TaxID=1848322 RepID=A0A4R4UU54_9ACTN|nr:hypothetical protein [Nonomuraea deserti]TDC92694.1 hypothetical protein E1292_41495 [Nonomuraea deserti]